MRTGLRTSGYAIFTLLYALNAVADDDATRSRARELAQQGMDAAKRGDHERARDYLHRAYTLVPAPTIAVREARSLRELGRWVDAVEAYVRAARTLIGAAAPDAFKDAVREAEEELAQLRPRIPKLEIQIAGVDPSASGFEVRVDGKLWPAALLGIPSPIDPGKHLIVARTASGHEQTARLDIAERESKPVKLTLPPELVSQSPKTVRTKSGSTQAEPTRNPDRTLAFVGLGVGAVGLAVGVGAGLASSKKYHSAETACPKAGCTPSGADDVDSFRQLRTISTIGYVVGAVGIGAGVTLWLTAPRAERAPRTGVYLGAASAGVRGTFK